MVAGPDFRSVPDRLNWQQSIEDRIHGMAQSTKAFLLWLTFLTSGGW